MRISDRSTSFLRRVQKSSFSLSGDGYTSRRGGGVPLIGFTTFVKQRFTGPLLMRRCGRRAAVIQKEAISTLYGHCRCRSKRAFPGALIQALDGRCQGLSHPM